GAPRPEGARRSGEQPELRRTPGIQYLSDRLADESLDDGVEPELAVSIRVDGPAGRRDSRDCVAREAMDCGLERQWRYAGRLQPDLPRSRFAHGRATDRGRRAEAVRHRGRRANYYRS